VARLSDPDVRPFHESGYEILDDELDTRREITIWSTDPLVPRLGDLFMVECGGVTHDIAVIEIVTFKRGWSATGRVVEVY
jgi:hypothetical protein